MDIRKLSGIGLNEKFSSRLTAATKYTSLRDKAGSISKIIKTAAGGRGFNSQRAWEKIKSSEKDLNWEQKRDVQQILKHLEKSAAQAAIKRPEMLDSKPKSVVASDYRVNRAAVARAEKNYEQMKSNLGTSQAAKRIQEKAYADWQEAKNKLDGGEKIGRGLPERKVPGVRIVRADMTEGEKPYSGLSRPPASSLTSLK
ncbi:MAG: hypothetical protein WC458_02790 [Patescibacteria group bacterium]|jgi:hypothetical protein